jgi:hypothetical protein
MRHEDKEKEIAWHFGMLLSTKQRRSLRINWGDLNYPSFDLADLDIDLQEDEVMQAISDMPKDNALGSDRLIGAFYTKCWEIMKVGVIQEIRQLSQLRGSTFNLFNSANIVLLLKKDQPLTVGDYRSISMVSSSQSAFIKKRCIHKILLFVQSLIKELHIKKISTLLIKLDIKKAFDSISWDYLLDLMEHLSFGPKWREWISIALATSSLRILLNGVLGRPIKHEGVSCRGTVLAHAICPGNGPLQKILQLTTEKNLLHSVV